MNLILVNQQTEWSVMFYVIHVSPELAPISSPKPLRGDVALQRPRQLFWVCLWRQVHRHLHQYYYNPPPGTFLSSLTTERKGVRGAVEGAVTPTLTYICHFLCNHSCVWVCAYFCQCVCVCVCVCTQACAGMRARQQGRMFASVRFVCVCAGSWRASVRSLHDSSKRSGVRPSEKSAVFPSPDGFILSVWNNSRQWIKPQ